MDKIKTSIGLVLSILLVLSIFLIVNKETDHPIVTSGEVVNTQVNVIQTEESSCNFTLNEGWNLVSFYCFGLFVPRSSALQSIDGSYDAIFYYESTDYDDPWKSYNPSLPNYAVQQLNYLDRLHGYWIHMTAQADFYFNGSNRTTSVHLTNGWNLVGNPEKKNNTVTVSFFNVSFNTLKDYEQTTGNFLLYHNYSVTNDFNDTLVYHGYWINSTKDQYWNVNG